MSDVMMQLGAFQFSISTAAYQQFDRNFRANWAKQARIGKNAAMQFVGIEETATFRGVIYPHYKGGIKQPARMRLLAMVGVPWPLMDGLGYFHGFWAITGVGESQTIHDRRSIPLKQEFSMEVERYDGGIRSFL